MGPLEGFKIIEIAGVGPGQLAGMLLADMGASVVRIDRPLELGTASPIEPRFDILNRNRPIIGVDLKTGEGAGLVLNLCEDADAIFEGFRPGVMERLGLGPDVCLERNPKLVYGRMTGWGQDGPLSDAAGHDPNFIALAGVYGAIGEKGADPAYPLNLVGDMGGGGTYLVIGLLAALLEAGRSGKGQVVDAAMVDGAASLMTMIHGLLAAGMWIEERGANILDGGAPFARAYRTLDDRHVVIAPVENRFFDALLTKLGISIEALRVSGGPPKTSIRLTSTDDLNGAEFNAGSKIFSKRKRRKNGVRSWKVQIPVLRPCWGSGRPWITLTTGRVERLSTSTVYISQPLRRDSLVPSQKSTALPGCKKVISSRF